MRSARNILLSLLIVHLFSFKRVTTELIFFSNDSGVLAQSRISSCQTSMPLRPTRTVSMTSWKIKLAFFMPICNRVTRNNPLEVLIVQSSWASSSSSTCQYADLRSILAKYLAPSMFLKVVSIFGMG
eukprot:Pompholyxophrys_punicea_v1_NODE_125_length_3327_cov_11.221815.p2 type:complete len:127 gc:universal NODE_125_length_3327_cov_11.221815:1651-2031(+)